MFLKMLLYHGLEEEWSKDFLEFKKNNKYYLGIQLKKGE